MFCSLKNRIELWGKFFGTLLLLLVLGEKNIHSECEISFLCGGRQSDSQWPTWFHRCRPGWHLGSSAPEQWQFDALLLQLVDRALKPKMSSQSLLFWFCFVYKPKNKRLPNSKKIEHLPLPLETSILAIFEEILWIGGHGQKDVKWPGQQNVVNLRPAR